MPRIDKPAELPARYRKAASTKSSEDSSQSSSTEAKKTPEPPKGLPGSAKEDLKETEKTDKVSA